MERALAKDGSSSCGYTIKAQAQAQVWLRNSRLTPLLHFIQCLSPSLSTKSKLIDEKLDVAVSDRESRTSANEQVATTI